MVEWLSNIAALGLTVMGLGAFALSQITHFRRMTLHQQFPGTRVLRCAATLLLASSLLLNISSQGVVMGVVIWTLAITPSGLGVTIMLCWYSHQKKQ